VSKFDKRIGSLIINTHDFITGDEYRLMLHYFQSRLEEMEKPADFEARKQALFQLERCYTKLIRPT
jgi:hypothetical protein